MAVINLFNGFMNPFGGSEQETLSLYSLLSRHHTVNLWATSSRASKQLLDKYPIKVISIVNGTYPRGGTYVFLGAHWRAGVWATFIPKPTRLIYVFNTFHPKIKGLVTEHPFWFKWPKAELVLISDFQKNLLKLDGVVHPSPIPIERFLQSSARGESGIFTIGRLSRDLPEKHHSDDVPLYKDWIQAGYRICIQGGSVLSGVLPVNDRCELLPEGALNAEDFYKTLDVFYYRSGEHLETFGRVVFEAMASGVPVVCHERGGYVEHIRHGDNGFLFATNAEAENIIAMLAKNQSLRLKVGEAGRETAKKLFSASALQERLKFYVESNSA